MECKNCGEDPIEHQEEHPELCCDCYDLQFGMSLDRLNVERKMKGKPPLEQRIIEKSAERDQSGVKPR